MKKALITGASSGIGLEYAKYLNQHGWSLDLVSNNEERSKTARDFFQGTDTNYYHYDLSKQDSVLELLNEIDCPDLIVANAGITKYGAAGSINKQEKRDLFYLLCNGVIDLIEEFIPSMINQGEGRIIIVSSIGAITPMPKSSIYASAKSAIYSYGQSLAKELSNKNISVTVSLPGYVRTDAHARAGLDHLKSKVPNWMWVSAEQVVKETERASIKKKSEIIPGIVYKLVRPFLKLSLANLIRNGMTKRKSKK